MTYFMLSYEINFAEKYWFKKYMEPILWKKYFPKKTNKVSQSLPVFHVNKKKLCYISAHLIFYFFYRIVSSSQ